MSYSVFTAEQLARVARADMQQSQALRYWLLPAHVRECHLNSRVPASGRKSYRVCRDCGGRLEYSVGEVSIQGSASAGMHGHCSWSCDSKTSHS